MFYRVDHLIALAIHLLQETWGVFVCLQSCTMQEGK